MNAPYHNAVGDGSDYVHDESDDRRAPYSPPQLPAVPQQEQGYSMDQDAADPIYNQSIQVSRQTMLSKSSISKDALENVVRLTELRSNETQKYEERDDFNYDDEDIQRDAADNTIVFIVHIAMGFFILLFFAALVVSALIVGQYGFLVFILICCLLLLGLTIGYFISKIMDKDRVMRPVRRKIRRWHAIATAVVVNEIKDFQLDIQDHLLLTNGDTGVGIYEAEDEGHVDVTGNRKRKSGPRSKIFRMLVKPLLKKKSNFRFGRKKKASESTNEAEHVGTHEMV